MTSPGRLAALVLMVTAAGGGAHAATSPFAGNWKLNTAKSRLTGDTFTYSQTANGLHASAGGVFEYDFAIDGAPHHAFADRTVTWVKAADGGWNVTFRAGDKVLSKQHTTLSADGSKLMTSSTSFRPDGTTAATSDVYQRMSKTTGLIGAWKSVAVKTTSDVMSISVPAPDRFKLVNASYKEVVEGKTDGSLSEVTGPEIPAGAGAIFKALSPSRWEHSALYKGKVMFMGVMSVTDDGHTLIDTTWVPGREAEREVEIFDRQ